MRNTDLCSERRPTSFCLTQQRPYKVSPHIYNNDRLQKSYIYKLLPNATTYPNVFNIIDKTKHRLKRKLIGQAISERAMRLFEPTMIEQIDIMISLFMESCQSASSKQPASVNITTLCKRLGVDVIGHLAFGFSLNTQTDDTYRFLIPGLVAGNLRANLYLQWPTLKRAQIDYILTLLTRKQRNRYFDLVDKMLTARLAQDVHAKTDLVSFLSEGFDAEAIKERDEIVNILRWDGIFFFSAGSDTTTSATCALFFYLSRNPEAYRKLAAEIRGAGFKSAADIRAGPTLSGCLYLRACINETLRLSPPVTGALWRERDPSFTSPIIIDGHVIPLGTQVGVNTYVLHHNAEYFPEPFRFQPDRWLTDDQAALKKMESAFAAFSVGPRACTGKPMAYIEMSLVFARTLWYTDFQAVPGKPGELGAGSLGQKYRRDKSGEYQLYDIFASTHDGPNLIFTPRGDYYKELNTDG
jgi:cytochrome P450